MVDDVLRLDRGLQTGEHRQRAGLSDQLGPLVGELPALQVENLVVLCLLLLALAACQASCPLKRSLKGLLLLLRLEV